MRIPIEWLNDFLTPAASQLEKLADDLTMAGLEVEETFHTPQGVVWFTKITPNRGDWASVYGTAREITAMAREVTGTDTTYQLAALPTGLTARREADAPTVSVTIEDPENCPRFMATVIQDVQIGETPQWLQDRLTAALGDRYRMINNVADITNYVMLELGQPLHAFDFDTIPQGEIVVRQTKEGEKLVTLDGSEHTLPSGTLAICDNTRAISIAGIMGGQETEITDSTTNVLLETAHFNPYCIRRTAKKVVRSEASYRFERFVDPDLVAIAAARAAQMIVEICGGKIVAVVDEYPRPAKKVRVLARMDRVRQILGADVDRDAAIGALERLGISVSRSAGAMDCVIPSWRPDLTIEEDIAEEVGRIALGYANLPETIPPLVTQGGHDSARGCFVQKLREVLVLHGLQEVQTHSLVSEGEVKLRSPRAPEYSCMRDALLPAHFTIAKNALKAGIREMAFFEVGNVYKRHEDTFTEPLRVTGIVAGDPQTGEFSAVKGIVEGLLSGLSLDAMRFTPTQALSIAHPYRTATVFVNNREVGVLGELSEGTIEENDLPKRTCFFDLDGDALFTLAQNAHRRYKPVGSFPAAVRDLAPVFPQSVPYATIEDAIRRSISELCESFTLADTYSGAGVDPGSHALTLRFTLRAPDRTITSEEIDTELVRVRAALEGVGGVFRA
jgi:phenylalanyl-tRNA synthetase beta chain